MNDRGTVLRGSGDVRGEAGKGDVTAASRYPLLCGPCDSTCLDSHTVSVLILVFL